MLPELRKVVTFEEDIHTEGGRASDPVLRMIGVSSQLCRSSKCEESDRPLCHDMW